MQRTIVRTERIRLEVGESLPAPIPGLTLLMGPVIRDLANNGQRLEADNPAVRRIVTRSYEDDTEFPSAWIPTDDNVALWLDASDVASIVSSDNDVTQINDKSGNGRHFTAVNNPQTGTRTVNGLNVIDFDDALDQFLHLSGYVPASTFQVIIAAVVDDPVASARALMRLGGTQRVEIVSVNSGFFGAYVQLFGGGNASGGQDAASLTGAPHIFRLFMDFANNDWVKYTDGALIHTETDGYTGAVNAVGGGPHFQLFSNNNGADTHNGALLGLQMFETDDETVGQKSVGQLADQWAITLDAGHPYAGGPP